MSREYEVICSELHNHPLSQHVVSMNAPSTINRFILNKLV